MHKLKAILIVILILVSLLPLYFLYIQMGKWLRPRESFSRFLCWLILVLAVIFVYTFAVVFIIRLLFPSA